MNGTTVRPALSWSTHALLTRGGLQSHDRRCLEGRARTVHLEDFLQRAQTELPELIGWYWHLLNRKAESNGSTDTPPPKVRTTADFLAVMQLNPGIEFHYVTLQPPEECRLDSPHDTERDGPPGRLYSPIPFGTDISAYDILFTYSDEPDWGMDKDLFSLEDYRYGSAPWGKISRGIGSQVPFHTSFLHEHPLLTRALPAVRKSFLEERVRVCFALAELAFKKGVNYWGWRFTAWAVHYLQDVTAPYHARAYPPAVFPTLLRFLLHPDLRSPAERFADILLNHHFLFERLVHLLLNEAVKKQPDHPLLKALEDEGESHDLTLEAIVDTVSRVASRLAPRIDRNLVLLFRDRHIDDTHYAANHKALEKSFDALIRNANPESPHYCDLVDMIGICLKQSGWITRHTVHHTCSSLML